MRLTGIIAALLLLAAGCSASTGNQAPEPTSGPGTTARGERTVDVLVEQIASGNRGPAGRRVVVADSAAELASATGLEVPESGEGLYVSAHAGERPTGGYRVAISGAGDGKIEVNLREPGEEDIVTQALTQPYAVAVVRPSGGQALEAGDLRFVGKDGESLGWSVHAVVAGGT